MVNPDVIWGYCWNCGKPYYEERKDKYCEDCGRLIDEGKLKKLLEMNDFYVSQLKSGN